jgi:purine-cytosine permease-like protein
MTTSDRSDHAYEESVMGRLPLLSGMRVYQTWFAWIAGAFAYGAATWGFLTGGFLGSFLPPGEAIASLFLGQTIALLFCVSFLGVVSTRYGIDTVDASKPAFGTRGAQLVTLLIVAIMIGWILVLVAFTGNVLQRFSTETLGASQSRGLLGVLSLVMVAACALIAMTGPRIFARLYTWLSPLMVVLVAVLLAVLISEHGLSELFSMSPPPEARLSGREGFALGVELGVGFGFAYWISMGAMFRLVKSPRMAIHGSMIGWALMTVPVISVAILSSVSLGSDDPTVWMYDLAGDWGGAVAMLFILIANITSTVLMLYIALIAVQQSQLLARVPSRAIIVAFCLPCIWVAFWPAKLFDWYPTFLYYNGVLIAPIAAVLAVDFFILRRRSIDVAAIFTRKPGTRYWFWGGANPVALVVVAVGFGFYNLLYNPVTAEYGEVFTYTTASVPTVLLCGALYWVLMRILVIPRGVGGYPAPARGTAQARIAEVAPGDLGL